MDVVQLWNSLLKNTFIFLFLSSDTIFSNLMKNTLKFIKLKKKDLKFKTVIFFLQMISLHRLHFQVCYKEIN